MELINIDQTFHYHIIVITICICLSYFDIHQPIQWQLGNYLFLHNLVDFDDRNDDQCSNDTWQQCYPKTYLIHTYNNHNNNNYHHHIQENSHDQYNVTSDKIFVTSDEGVVTKFIIVVTRVVIVVNKDKVLVSRDVVVGARDVLVDSTYAIVVKVIE